jgi:hypothetical protein
MSAKDFYQKVDYDKLEKAMLSDNPEDLARVAKEAGMELSDEQLDYVVGGLQYTVTDFSDLTM